MDFNAFLESTLVPEVQIQEQGYNLLRRRIAIVLGQWFPVKLEQLNKNAIYQIFQYLLSKQDSLNDLVVRITAGRQLRHVLDPYEFSPTEFMPYAPSILQNLMGLIQEVELSESKMALLDTVCAIVIKMEHHVCAPSVVTFVYGAHANDTSQIDPFSDQILALLPPLWDQSGEEHLMKQAILTLLSALIDALKQDSVKYHSLVLPLIRSSVEPGSVSISSLYRGMSYILMRCTKESLLYLLEEALGLWSSIMTQTTAPASPEVLSLLPTLFPMFVDATDSVPQALQIAESYIILAPQEVLNDRIRLPMLSSFETLLRSTTRQRLGTVPRLVELMIRAAETVDGGSENTYNVISQSLIDSAFLTSLLEGLHSAHEASQTTGPTRKTTQVYGVVETDYLSVLARLALANPKILASAVATTTGTSEEQAMSWILTEWFSHYDNIGSVNQKKLHALSLTQLLALNGPDTQPPLYILNHLQSYLTVWTDIVTELADGADEDPNSAGDYLIYWNQTQPGKFDEHEPPENERRRQWETSDVIHNINIRDFVRQRLHSLIVGCGGEQRFQEEWLLNVDREVVTAFGALGLF